MHFPDLDRSRRRLPRRHRRATDVCRCWRKCTSRLYDIAATPALIDGQSFE
jgi:hypothetical protein